MQTKGEVRSHGSSSGGISNKKRKLSHGSVTLTSDTRPKHLESEITLEPSERVKSNNGMTINKRAGTNKNRHLFVLPGLLHAEALQQQTAPSTQHVDQSQDTPLGSQTDTEIPLSQPLLESQSYENLSQSTTTKNDAVSGASAKDSSPAKDAGSTKRKQKGKASNEHLQIGKVSKLNTVNPELYIELNGGRLKLVGNIVYPKNRFITLLCLQQGGNKIKDVLCDNTFDSIVVFNQAEFVSTQVFILWPFQLRKIY